MINRLAQFRQQRGFSAAQLAGQAGVTRQTIHAMEAGSYVPNTLVALKLARALDVNVEELFQLDAAPAPPETETETVELLPGAEPPQPGQPLQLCRVDGRLMAARPSPVPCYLPESDAVAGSRPSAKGKAKVHVFRSPAATDKLLLIAGCDPGISVLARHVRPAGVELVLAHRNSSQALQLLKEGRVHAAGTHLRDDKSGESNLPQIARLFPQRSVAVVSFAIWEEGILFAQSNPKNITGIEDLARRTVLIVNREPGAGSRLLLDTRLQRLGIQPAKIRGYDRMAAGHLDAAWRVHSGTADCCIATRAAARMFGLGFIPLAAERYDVVVQKRHLDLPAMQTLLDTLAQSAFRRELESLGGYDAKPAGQRLL